MVYREIFLPSDPWLDIFHKRFQASNLSRKMKTYFVALLESFNPSRRFRSLSKSCLLISLQVIGFLSLFNLCRLEGIFLCVFHEIFARRVLAHSTACLSICSTKCFYYSPSLDFNWNWIINESEGIANLRNDGGATFLLPFVRKQFASYCRDFVTKGLTDGSDPWSVARLAPWNW